MISTVPEAFLSRLAHLPHEYPREATGYIQKGTISFRVNTLKANDTSVLDEVATTNARVTPSECIRHAYTTDVMDAEKLTSLQAYHDGWFYIQSVSSMLPVYLLDPQPGEKVLDLCAAPGSKTTYIAQLQNNDGTILANDNSRKRLYKLEALAARFGATTIQTSCHDGRSLWMDHVGEFDKTLVDVPCSMEGRMWDPLVAQNWSLREIKRLSNMQRWLLRSGVSATKTGGRIVYSTCTVAPEENEQVVDWLLKKDGARVRLVEPAHTLPNHIPGITKWGDKQFDPQLTKTRRIVPDQHHEAFFVAVFEKL